MVRPLLRRAVQRLHRRLPPCVISLSSSSAVRHSWSRFQPFPQRPSGVTMAAAGHVTVIRHSPLLWGGGFYRRSSIVPTTSGFGQWYPYPQPFGFPPGIYHGDGAVALRLQVTPREASVFVDGYAAGVVDDYDGVFQRLRLVPGPHEIVIYHPSHRTLRQSIYYNPGSTHTIRHTLDPLMPGEAPDPQPVPRAMPAYPGSARAHRRCRPARTRAGCPTGARRNACAARAARRRDGARRRRAVARTADAGPARDSARGRAASRPHRETRIPDVRGRCRRARRRNDELQRESALAVTVNRAPMIAQISVTASMVNRYQL